MYDDMESKLETKLIQLDIVVQRTQRILDSGKRESIKRHLEALVMTVRETSECKRVVEAEKIEESIDISDINKWSDEIESKIEKGDNEIVRLNTWLREKEQQEWSLAQEEQFDSDIKLHERKLRMQSELTAKHEKQETNPSTAKLPKLVISKFEGSVMDWSKFWGQFSEAVDKSSIPPITKLTYLCELLSPKVKRCIEALPFTTEGYNRAKAVLNDK